MHALTLTPNMNDLGNYLRAVRSQPMLSVQEELRLATAWRDQQDVDAARQLVLSHLRYVVRIARGYRGYGLQEADLIQEGNLGLMKAVKRFDPDHGVRLVSFAIHWIKAEIQEFVLRNWRIVKVATTKPQRKLFFKLRSTRDKLEPSDLPQHQMIARELNVKVSDVAEMESRLMGRDVSIDSAASDDAEDQPLLSLPATTATPAEHLLEKDWDAKQNTHLHHALSQLPARDRLIIEHRWLSDAPQTLQSLGDRLGISTERVRQIEKQAMQKLKQHLSPQLGAAFG